jgi:F0F1-type ATP synthase alpha subunit
VGKFEQELLRTLRGPSKKLLETIRKEQKLDDKTEAELKKVIESVLKIFSK